MAGNTGAVAAPAATVFGVPGYTRPTEHLENNDGTTSTPKQSSSNPVTGLIAFKQTDVIRGWRMLVTEAVTTAAGTTTLNLSQYFPYVNLGNVQLSYQNQFSPINVFSGIDLAVFQSYRPYYFTENHGRNLLDTSYGTFPYNNQANLISASNYTTASTTVKFALDLPASVAMDRYWQLNPDGTIPQGVAPMRAIVTPQFMAGSARIVTPNITHNAVLVSGAGTSDIYPYYASGTQTTPGTATGLSTTYNFQRIGYYQPQGQADSPLLFPWQYSRKSVVTSIAGKSVVDIPIPLNGQLLSVFVRMYDPSANNLGGILYGAPVPLGNITKAQLLYGSGLYRFQDTPALAQLRFARQHGFLPWDGLVVWDMMLDDQGMLTNEGVINTMSTSGVTAHLEFTGAQSATAYAVIGTEALTWVSPS